MEFTSFDVDCDGDYVKIYSLSHKLNSLYSETFCGTNIPPIFKIQEVIRIEFVTDYVTERRGFQVAWRPISKLVFVIMFIY